MERLEKKFPKIEEGIYELMELVPQFGKDIGLISDDYLSYELLSLLLSRSLYGNLSGSQRSRLKCSYGKFVYNLNDEFVLRISVQSSYEERQFIFSVHFKKNYSDFEKIKNYLVVRGWENDDI